MGIKNFLSFGADDRLKRKQAEFDDIRLELDKAMKDLDLVRARANNQVQSFVQIKERSVETLRFIHHISKGLAAKDRLVGETANEAPDEEGHSTHQGQRDIEVHAWR